MAAALNSNAKTCFLKWFIERLEHGCSIDYKDSGYYENYDITF